MDSVTVHERRSHSYNGKKHKGRTEGWWWKMMWEKFSDERP